MRVALGLVLSFITVSASAVELTDATAADIGARFAAEISCGTTDVNRAWCSVAKIGKEPFSAPKSAVTLLGFSTQLIEHDKVVPSLATTTLAELHIGPTGARITALTPSNEEEKRQSAEIAATVKKALQGQATTVHVSTDLVQYFATERDKPRGALTHAKSYATFAGTLPARIYRVGKTYVVIEPAGIGFYVSVFTNAPVTDS